MQQLLYNLCLLASTKKKRSWRNLFTRLWKFPLFPLWISVFIHLVFMCVSLFPMTCRSVWVCERHPWLNSSITVCGDPWEQTGPRACLAAFGRLIVVTQHCLRTGGAAGFNYGSVLRWETANFHSHISSLVTFSQCVLHVCSNWFEDFCSPQWFLFFLLRIFLPLVKPSLNISSLFFFFTSISTTPFTFIHKSLLLLFLGFLSRVLSTLLLSLLHFILLCCFLPPSLSPHLILHSLSSIPSFFLLLALPLSG